MADGAALGKNLFAAARIAGHGGHIAIIVHHLLAVGVRGAGKEVGRGSFDLRIPVLQQATPTAGVDLSGWDLTLFHSSHQLPLPGSPAQEQIEHLRLEDGTVTSPIGYHNVGDAIVRNAAQPGKGRGLDGRSLRRSESTSLAIPRGCVNSSLSSVGPSFERVRWLP